MIKILDIKGRKVAIKGISKLFYQEGFPISMSVEILEKKGIEVSIFHIADECLKNGWSAKTTVRKIIDDFSDSLIKINKEELIKFCYSSYEEQRNMIFEYIFNINHKFTIEEKLEEFCKEYSINFSQIKSNPK